MNYDIVESFAQMVREKGIDKDVLGGILEEIFGLLVKKKYGEEAKFDVVVNMDRGDIEIFLEREIVKNDNTYFLQTAVIIVVNNFLDSSEEIKLDNQKSRGFLRDVISKNCYEDSLALEIINSNLNICFIDASAKGYEIPDKIMKIKVVLRKMSFIIKFQYQCK